MSDATVFIVSVGVSLTITIAAQVYAHYKIWKPQRENYESPYGLNHD